MMKGSVNNPGSNDASAATSTATVYDDASPATETALLITPAGTASSPIDVPEVPQSDTSSCCATLREYKPAFKVALFMFLMSVPPLIAAPVLVSAKKDYFGNAKKAALVQSIVDCSVAAVNTVLAPTYGRCLDAFGRRKFFLAAAVLQIAAFACLTALPTQPIVYMIVNAVYQLIQSTYSIAYLSDVLAPHQRSKGFGIASAIAGFSLFTGIFSGLIAAPDRIFYMIAAISAGLALLWAFFMLPESLPADKHVKLSRDLLRNPFADFSVLFSSRVMLICTGTIVLVQACDAGIQDFYLFYLQSRVGFNKGDFGYLELELGFLGPLAVLVIMPFLLNRVSPSLVLSVALFATCIAWVIVGTIWAKWPIFAIAVPIAGLISMASPILSGIVVNAGQQDGAARRLTGMSAVSDLAGALGPLIFGVAYAQLPDALEALPFFLGGGFCLVGAYLATRITGAILHDVAAEVREEVGDETAPLDEALIQERAEARLRDAAAPAEGNVEPWHAALTDEEGTSERAAEDPLSAGVFTS